MSWGTDEGLAALGQPTLRRHNLGVVLRHLRDRGARSRARLAADTGLNKATVSSLVKELAGRGLVSEGAPERGSIGRPGQVIDIDGRTVCGVGVELNVDHLATVALDLRGATVTQRRLSVRPAGVRPEEVIDRLAVLIEETVAEVIARGGLPVGVTVGAAGLVDVDAGVLTLAPNLGWRDVPLADELGKRLARTSYPLRIDNQANLAAMAEWTAVRRPGGTTGRDLVVLAGGYGLGGGVVSSGRLLRGRRGFAGEVGHIRIDPGGPRCACGRTGCWETRVGLRALLSAAANRDDPVHDARRPVENRLAALDRRAESGDERTLTALRELGRWLGVGAATLVNVLDPGLIVLSGYFSNVGRWVLDSMQAGLVATSMPPRDNSCRVEVSTLGLGAAVRGAAQAAMEPVFENPTAVPRTSPTTRPQLTAGGAR